MLISDVATPRESHPHSIRIHNKYAFVIIHHHWMKLHNADGFGDPVPGDNDLTSKKRKIRSSEFNLKFDNTGEGGRAKERTLASLPLW